MHSLLKRQINKLLGNPNILGEEMTLFLEAVGKSYENYDDKLYMLQRASTISSEELHEANQNLEKEAIRQKNILISLENAIRSLKGNLKENEAILPYGTDDFNAEHLAQYIGNLAHQVSKMTEEKDGLLKDLEEKNRALNNYAQIVSHDLKSPIRNINALMSWIVSDEQEKFSEHSKKNCSLVAQNLEKMDKLIAGILEHASLGRTEEQRVTFSLEKTLREIVQTLYVPDNVVISFQEGLPTMFFERTRLEQLFMNLITNAVTAVEDHKEGTIHIGYEPDEVYWKFSISDNGKGIAERHQTGIFDMFKKLEDDVRATGIGLSIVKKIIEIYDGTIWLKSKEGKGTTFYFTLKK